MWRKLLNLFLNGYSYFHGQERCLGHPKISTIELTNLCQMNCKMCPRSRMTRPLGLMDFQLYRRIIDQIRPYANNYVCLHGFGDSLLHPQIGRFISYAAEKGFKTTLSTNPSSLQERVIRILFDSGLYRLIIALDGTNPLTYRYLRGPRADYHEALQNIHLLLKTKLEEGRRLPLIEISMIRMKETDAEVEHFKRLWKRPGVDHVFIKTFKTWDGSQPEIMEMAEGSQYSSAFRNPRPYPCFRLWLVMSVLWDGRVVPCCYDYDAKCVLGNLQEQTLLQIWNGDRLREIRRHALANDYSQNPLCRHCREREGAPTSRLYPLNLLKLVQDFGPRRIYDFLRREGN